MALELHEAEFCGIGARSSNDQSMVGKLHISFLDTEKKLVSNVVATVFLPKDASMTLGQIQAAGRIKSLELLKAAVAALEADDIPTLEKKGMDVSGAHIDIMVSKD